MITRKWPWVAALLLSVTLVAAQDTCPTVVQEALSALDAKCQTTERNQACYGNIALTAIPQSGVTEFKFDAIGDIADLDDINTLDLAPLDPVSNQWGLVMMRVQADIPDSLPGQNVTFILFGDVTIQNAAVEGETPMQAFYLTTGIGDANCADAPESGLMVQTPSGVKDVSFNVNGVDVQMGSTVIFQAQPGQEMNVKTIEGKAILQVGEEIIPVVQGSEFTAPINENLEIIEPGEVIPYEPEEVEFLPIQSLEREIEIAPPLTELQIEEVKTLEAAGERLCSDEERSFLPPCTRPLIDANGEELKFDETGAPILFDRDGKPLLYDETSGEPILSMDQYDRRLDEWTEVKPRRDLNDDDSIIYPTLETTKEGPVFVPRDPIIVTKDPDEPREQIEPTKVPGREVPPTEDPNKPREQIEPTKVPGREVPPTEDPNKRPIEPTTVPEREIPPTEDPNKQQIEPTPDYSRDTQPINDPNKQPDEPPPDDPIR
jgi:hypothetical protein